jgi:hypothetical protein
MRFKKGTTSDKDNVTSQEASLLPKRETLDYLHKIPMTSYDTVSSTNENDEKCTKNMKEYNLNTYDCTTTDHLQSDLQRQYIKSTYLPNIDETKNDWFGDKMLFHDHWPTGEYTETMHIVAININGIAKQLDWLEWDTTVKTMYTLQIDMLGVTEPNVNFNNNRTLLQFRDIAKKTDKNIQLATSCSNQLNSTEKNGRDNVNSCRTMGWT